MKSGIGKRKALNEAASGNGAIAALFQVERLCRAVPEQRCNAKMRSLVLIVLLGLSTLLVVGCPARWKVVFINGSGQHLSVQLSGALDGKTRSFTLSEGGSHSEDLGQVQHLAVFAPSGNLLFERDDFGNKHLVPPLPGKYPHIYILLTTTNAYVVPPDYGKTWREHINEITKPRA